MQLSLKRIEDIVTTILFGLLIRINGRNAIILNSVGFVWFASPKMSYILR
jgi:hypothetical protein